MDSPQNWEINGYLKIDNSFLRFINEQAFFPFSKYYQEYPTTTALISSIFLLIGVTGFLFLHVIYIRLKFNRYQKLKAQKFLCGNKIFFL